MSRIASLAVVCVALSAACSGSGAYSHSPSGPSVARLPRLARTRFVAFGDSLTSGEITAPISSRSAITALTIVPGMSYPEVLQRDLQDAYSAQASTIAVLNEGKGGETLSGGVARFDSTFASDQPDVVLLQEGVNGVAVDGAEVSTTMMRQMVRRAKDGNAMVFVGSMIPTLPNRQRSQNQPALEAYNVALKAMCAEERVMYVDLYNGMMPQADQWIGIDGLHPNEAGYRRIADLFFAAIKSQLEQ